jgi:hypothetical protein
VFACTCYRTTDVTDNRKPTLHKDGEVGTAILKPLDARVAISLRMDLLATDRFLRMNIGTLLQDSQIDLSVFEPPKTTKIGGPRICAEVYYITTTSDNPRSPD